MRTTTIFVMLLSLTGCGIADHFSAQSQMQSAEQDYRKCLAANSDKPDTCEPLKQVWVTDQAAYQAGNY